MGRRMLRWRIWSVRLVQRSLLLLRVMWRLRARQRWGKLLVLRRWVLVMLHLGVGEWGGMEVFECGWLWGCDVSDIGLVLL